MTTGGIDLEVRLDRIERTLKDVVGVIHGGETTNGLVTFEKSIRGRLHEMTTMLQAAQNLENAARDLRRAQGRKWTKLDRVVLAVCACVTASCAVVTAVYVIVG